jgi:fructose-bisphosphate aldolase class II
MAKVPVAINEDHGPSFAAAIQNIKNGVTSIMVDRSSLPFEENVRQVRELVRVAHSCGVSVEAELGHVGQADNYAADSSEEFLTKPEDAVRYIKETGVDCLAVAIGTAHGKYPDGFVPTIHFDRLKEIKDAVGDFPLVLHGSSGTRNEDLYKVCRMGINKININTDLQAAGAAAVKAGGRGGVWRLAQQGWKNKLLEMIKIYGSDGKAW